MKNNKFSIFSLLLILFSFSFNTQAQQFTQEELEQFQQTQNSVTAEEIERHNNSIDQEALNDHNNSISKEFLQLVDETNANDSCDVPSDEQLVCEALMCVIGIAIPASAGKCAEVLVEFAIYKASLGPFKSPPSCKSRNEECQTTGKASEAPTEVECQQLGLGNDPCEWLNES